MPIHSFELRGILFKNSFKFVPFIRDFLPVDDGVVLQLQVLEKFQLLISPIRNNVSILHHLKIPIPVRFFPLGGLIEQKKREQQLVSIWVLEEDVLVELDDILQLWGVLYSSHRYDARVRNEDKRLYRERVRIYDKFRLGYMRAKGSQ